MRGVRLAGVNTSLRARFARLLNRGFCGRLGWGGLLVCRLALASLGGNTSLFSATTTPPQGEIVEVAGTVEVLLAGEITWQTAQPHQFLKVGDRLRTLAASRAALRLTDQSILRINQSTTLRIQPPRLQTQKRRFRLDFGTLFLFHRAKPAEIEFETPLVAGAIRGTEFVLAADEGATQLALLDGQVDLETEEGLIRVGGGEQVRVRPGRSVERTALIETVNLVQWALYYPAVLHLEDLRLAPDAARVLHESLAAYSRGNLLEALRRYPPDYQPKDEATSLYLAALQLSVGQVTEAERWLETAVPSHPVANALRELIAAVRLSPFEPAAPPKTASEWTAHAYSLQSKWQLSEARAAAEEAVRLAPDFGFAWVRLAEMELAHGRHRAAVSATDRAIALVPEDAQAQALKGFILLDAARPGPAAAWFESALKCDASLGNAWLGRGLSALALGEGDHGVAFLLTATALEPQRSLVRSYLGKAWAQEGESARAEKELRLAQKLDPADPTPWLYSALTLRQRNQLNDAVRQLDQALELNSNRSVFRSRFMLDRDLAVQSADLAALYAEVGLEEAGQRAASRALETDYAGFSAHLFRAQSLLSREDPARFDLRLETPRQSEWLLANLLAPVGGGNLSQLLSLQDRAQYFDQRPFGATSLTEYRSAGDWLQSASLFGALDDVAYAVDVHYQSLNGQRPNAQMEQSWVSLQSKLRLSLADDAYLQAGYFRASGGDVAQHYDPADAGLTFRTAESQEPQLHLGYHREWSPGSHTLVLFSHLTDRLTLDNQDAQVLFIRQAQDRVTGVQTDPFFESHTESDVALESIEAQHLWQTPQHRLILGARYQSGKAKTEAQLSRELTGPVSVQGFEPDLQRGNVYAYYQWHPWEPLRLTAGVSYDTLEFPLNVDVPPITDATDERSLWAPKAALTYQPWRDGQLRAVFSRSLGGVYFDTSLRLEPTELAGFTTAFRSLIPESSVGLVPGNVFETAAVGFDQRWGQQTYFGIELERLNSAGQRGIGALTNSTPFPVPDTPGTVRQTLDFTERGIAIYLTRLVGRDWALGVRYEVRDADLDARFPDLPTTVPGVARLNQNVQATLGQLQLFARYNHPSGLFGEWESDWYHQSNRGYEPDLPGDRFWQHHVHVGYRFPGRRAELRLGLLNLADQDYRLNPLNLHPELPRGRTLTTQLRLNF